MPSVTPQQELDFLAELIGSEPEGMSIDAISQSSATLININAVPCSAA